jgi:hypothetical protein
MQERDGSVCGAGGAVQRVLVAGCDSGVEGDATVSGGEWSAEAQERAARSENGGRVAREKSR